MFCVVLGGGEEILAKKPATEGEFIKILECERIQFSKCIHVKKGSFLLTFALRFNDSKYRIAMMLMDFPINIL